MGRTSHSLSKVSPKASLDAFSGEITPELDVVVRQIDNLLADHHGNSLKTYWHVGKLITDVERHPQKYLTESQQAAQIDAGNLLMHMFDKIYTADQLRTTQSFYQAYPKERDLNALIALRCPERPAWRLTVSHVQVLTTIPDPEQRQALVEQCAEEAYTARTLASEVQEIRGTPTKKSGRSHQAPKGLKQQVQDVLAFQKRFIGRSENLWLADEGVYDAVMNAPASKRSEAIANFVVDMRDNFDRMRELVDDHIAMCDKVLRAIDDDAKATPTKGKKKAVQHA